MKEVFLDGNMPKSKCKIAKGCKLWGTTLGEQCVVEEKVKLTNVIALDAVLIKTGVVAEGCILSSQCVIGANATIKECLVGPKYHVPSEGLSLASPTLLTLTSICSMKATIQQICLFRNCHNS